MSSPDVGYDVGSIPVWAADNGCYSAGERFSLPRYLAWLERWRPHAARCLFATAPDVVGDASATRARSLPVLPVIAALGYVPAYVLQDGETRIPDDAAAVFVGGSTAFKLSPDAAGLVAAAKSRGLWAHMGRVNSARRLRYAAGIGCDSADGTLLAFDPAAPVDQWLRQPAEPPLF